MKETINQVAQQIKAKIGGYTPKIGIILGSGLGGVAEAIENPVIIPYEEIEGFPKSTVSGHAGRLVADYRNGDIHSDGAHRYARRDDREKVQYDHRLR